MYINGLLFNMYTDHNTSMSQHHCSNSIASTTLVHSLILLVAQYQTSYAVIFGVCVGGGVWNRHFESCQISGVRVNTVSPIHYSLANSVSP